MDKRPERYRNAVVAHIYVEGAADAIAFYERAFGAREIFRVVGKNGKIFHGEIAICGSVVMIGDPGAGGLYGEPRKLGGCTAGLHVMVDDNEALLRRATAARAKEVQASDAYVLRRQCGLGTRPVRTCLGAVVMERGSGRC
jgi:PhnB protein